ncbi:MAG: formate dehydrogenase subunit beta [Ectothiorhodospiraceae bacterium]|nr:formate dehydrogenase subunit beta [Ectothiorhodospiraceae bacterium]
MATLQSLDVVERSATTVPTPQARDGVPKLAKLIDVAKCIGCKACQVACSQWNDLSEEVGQNVGVYDNPADLSANTWTLMRFAEQQRADGGLEWLIRKDGCMHCEDPGCLKACPAPGAIVKYANGIVDFISENCIGCGYCIKGCPFDVPRLSERDNKAYKCSLCSDRVAVGLEPACVKTCPTSAIKFGTKDDMLEYGEKRVTQLKERGFQNAGVYDPQGVGGTHVMYVLQHADKPENYVGLPAEPQIASMVGFWKGLSKPWAAALLGLSVLGAFLHYVTHGPNEVDEDHKNGEEV